MFGFVMGFENFSCHEMKRVYVFLLQNVSLNCMYTTIIAPYIHFTRMRETVNAGSFARAHALQQGISQQLGFNLRAHKTIRFVKFSIECAFFRLPLALRVYIYECVCVYCCVSLILISSLLLLLCAASGTLSLHQFSCYSL